MPTLEAAVAHIDARLSKWYRDELRQEADNAKSMLLRYREQVGAMVQQVRELTEWDLGQGPLAGLGGTPTERLNIQELLALDFDDVESALWKDVDKEKSRILFKIRCIAHVIATPQPAFPFLEPSKFTVGGGKAPTAFYRMSDLNPTPMQKDIPVTLFGEAQLAKVNSDWNLVGVKIDRSLPDEEWKELQRFTISLK